MKSSLISYNRLKAGTADWQPCDPGCLIYLPSGQDRRDGPFEVLSRIADSTEGERLLCARLNFVSECSPNLQRETSGTHKVPA